MKPIKFNAILSGVSTKSDGSLSLRISTPEMDAAETTVLLKLCRINLDCLLTPLNEELDPPTEVVSEIETKTPSQRLRAVLFVWHKQLSDAGKMKSSWPEFYAAQMERMINTIKEALEKPPF